MDQTEELYELVIALQAEISAFKELFLKPSPKLDKKYQELAKKHRAVLLRARKSQNEAKKRV